MILNKVHFFSLWVFFVYGIWERRWHLGAALYPFGSGAPLRNGSAAPRMLPVFHFFSKYDVRGFTWIWVNQLFSPSFPFHGYVFVGYRCILDNVGRHFYSLLAWMGTTVSSGVMFMLATSHDGRLLLITLGLLVDGSSPSWGIPFVLLSSIGCMCPSSL